MITELHNTNVDLKGILEVLGENLYSSPSVAIRELIQNSFDACIRSSIENDSEKEYEITLECDSQGGFLTISDNGSGLTYDEVLKYLATIGSGYTRVLKQKQNTEEAIGFFGLGFLTAYVISEKVEVLTTSFKTPDETWHFSSKSGSNFSIKQSKKTIDVGTTVKLKLKNEFSELCSEEVVRSLVKRYCCFLPIKICFADKKSISDLILPWKLDEELPSSVILKLQNELAEFFENDFSPLCTYQIPSDNPFNIRGLFWIHDSSGYATSDYRNMNIFIRSMMISDQARDLLPSWAGFIGCVIDTPVLSPTASREDIVKDSNYYQVKTYINNTLIDMLLKIANEQPDMWQSILRRHNQALLGAAINEDNLFYTLQNSLKVPTSRGDLPLSKVVSMSNQSIYIKNNSKDDHESIILKSKGTPIVSGYFFAASSFCQKYSEANGIPCVYLGTKSSMQALLPKLDIEESDLKKLSRLFKRNDETLIASSFEPSYIPLIFIEDQDAKLKQDIEKDECDKNIGTAALMLAKLYTEKLETGNLIKLIVNISNPTVQKLLTEDTKEQENIAAILRSFMLSQCSDMESIDINYLKEIESFSRTLNKLI